nr:scopoletin glucosyltransferase-like [Ipomoea batatas]
MLPMVDIARQFASHGVKATLLTTPLNAARISKTIQRDREHGNQITIRVLEFPYKESGLPEGHENLSDTTTSEQTHSFFNALDHFQRPVEQFVAEDRPDCIVAVTQILKIGVPVGARVWARRTDRRVPINRENIEAAVKELMAGEEAEERRSRAIALGNLAKKAVEPGGSSDADLSCLLEELKKNRK